MNRPRKFSRSRGDGSHTEAGSYLSSEGNGNWGARRTDGKGDADWCVPRMSEGRRIAADGNRNRDDDQNRDERGPEGELGNRENGGEGRSGCRWIVIGCG